MEILITIDGQDIKKGTILFNSITNKFFVAKGIRDAAFRQAGRKLLWLECLKTGHEASIYTNFLTFLNWKVLKCDESVARLLYGR